MPGRREVAGPPPGDEPGGLDQRLARRSDATPVPSRTHAVPAELLSCSRSGSPRTPRQPRLGSARVSGRFARLLVQPCLTTPANGASHALAIEQAVSRHDHQCGRAPSKCQDLDRDLCCAKTPPARDGASSSTFACSQVCGGRRLRGGLLHPRQLLTLPRDVEIASPVVFRRLARAARRLRRMPTSDRNQSSISTLRPVPPRLRKLFLETQYARVGFSALPATAGADLHTSGRSGKRLPRHGHRLGPGLHHRGSPTTRLTAHGSRAEGRCCGTPPCRPENTILTEGSVLFSDLALQPATGGSGSEPADRRGRVHSGHGPVSLPQRASRRVPRNMRWPSVGAGLAVQSGGARTCRKITSDRGVAHLLVPPCGRFYRCSPPIARVKMSLARHGIAGDRPDPPVNAQSETAFLVRQLLVAREFLQIQVRI